MTSNLPRTVFRSVELTARVTTLLARTLPECGPGGQDGFRVTSHDYQEPRRMFVRWYDDGRKDGVEQYRAQIADTLAREGYAVTLPPGCWDVYVADRPVNTSGPRYAPIPSDLPFGDPWVVVDQWTRAEVTTAATEEEAKAAAMRAERRHALTDARMVTAPELHDHLVRADELLGDGLTWLRREVHAVTRYGAIVRRERIDALVQVANALRAGRAVTEVGRMVAWAEPVPMLTRAHPPLTYDVQWVPKSAAPAVGYFPSPAWQRGPAENAAITLLIEGGLQPVVYGESVGDGAWMCEQNGFMVSAADPTNLSVPGIHVDAIGQSAHEQQERVPEVLRGAGWRVEGDRGWAGAWTAFPPAG
ncbi:hypothetical protein [Streptomyces tirandamycinicus]|uniref:Uncharacterized protein n=1 Tax=Streptomyces tirandamycinicus TaxID=2174846 RepID=A0A2S1T1W2_9ACTN|nr:hypothetical protein [Streptomyces tirandamycinicus]AWI32652.1 hypothetical protein DDW44_30500 [Streptomyces tirandamycinicus]